MITTLAEVIAVKERQVVVRCQRKSACNACAAKESCATNTVANAMPSKDFTLTVPTDKPIAVGSIIEIGMQESVLVKSAMLIYLLPLVFFIAGALISHLLSQNEQVVIAASFISGAAGFYLARYKTAQFESQINSQPCLLRVIWDKKSESGNDPKRD